MHIAVISAAVALIAFVFFKLRASRTVAARPEAVPAGGGTGDHAPVAFVASEEEVEAPRSAPRAVQAPRAVPANVKRSQPPDVEHLDDDPIAGRIEDRTTECLLRSCLDVCGDDVTDGVLSAALDLMDVYQSAMRDYTMTPSAATMEDTRYRIATMIEVARELHRREVQALQRREAAS